MFLLQQLQAEHEKCKRQLQEVTNKLQEIQDQVLWFELGMSSMLHPEVGCDSELFMYIFPSVVFSCSFRVTDLRTTLSVDFDL